MTALAAGPTRKATATEQKLAGAALKRYGVAKASFTKKCVRDATGA
jgi:hypothetical protein